MLANRFDLVVAGFHPETGQWHDLGLLIELADLPDGPGVLERVHLRAYAPEDYLCRWKQFLDEAAGYCAGQASAETDNPFEPGEPSSDTGPLCGDARADILIRMRRLGITQQALAEQLNVRQPYVCRMLGGKGHGILARRLEEIRTHLAHQEAG